MYYWASLVAQMVKRLPAMRETRVQSLGQEDPLEKEMATHSSILAWTIKTLHFSSVTQSCPILSEPMDYSMPGLPVHHQLPNFTLTHVHWVGDAIQPSHPLSPPSPVLNLSHHQGLSQWVDSLHQVAKVVGLQHQSFQLIFKVDFL